MIRSLTPDQLSILRRSRNGLRVWEEGAALRGLVTELHGLVDLGLVAFDDAAGYSATPAGEACLIRLDV